MISRRRTRVSRQKLAKGQTHWTGFDDKIISMYARGMTTREIQGHLEEMYNIEVTPTLISNVTEAVIEEVKLARAAAGRALSHLSSNHGAVSRLQAADSFRRE